MSCVVEQVPRLPPRWFVRFAWHAHRALYRVTGGRVGLWRARSNRASGVPPRSAPAALPPSASLRIVGSVLQQVILAWEVELAPTVIPIPGASCPASI
jgi:hypothetical protein